MNRLGKILLLVGGLAIWYTFTGQPTSSKKEYPLPNEIRVVGTTLPYTYRPKEMSRISPDSKDLSKEKISNSEDKERSISTDYEEPPYSKKSWTTSFKDNELEKIVRTADIDFSRDFKIRTERYRLVTDKDWLISRLIGHVASIPCKLYFWDWDVGWGLDEDRARAVLSMLENNKNINGVTVRINHNKVWYDCYRLFGDKKVADRNNLLARLFIGLPMTFSGELFAELRRGDYYNPMTQTAILYSNIEAISAHEIGHNQDFSRFTSDWEYQIARVLPPVMLYQEWQASMVNARKNLGPDDKWQFKRYLLPAFLTYLLAFYGSSKKFWNWLKER